VTGKDDIRTWEVAEANYGARVVFTDAMYGRGRRFSLGAAINEGLKSLKLDDWVLVIDADIMLPPNARQTLERVPLVRNGIHGIDRVHCRGRAAWDRFTTEPRPVREWEVGQLRDFPVGARITAPASVTGDPRLAGYVPLGFFQLWNAAQNGIRDYPIDERGTAEGSDILHALRWPRISRQLIPDLVGIELGTDQPTDVGVNWNGRRTPEFSLEGGPYRR
jgi:glycosyltransferase involved in cell wall biosynthesis